MKKDDESSYYSTEEEDGYYYEEEEEEEEEVKKVPESMKVDDDIDDSLWDIVDAKKARTPKIQKVNKSEDESADSSERHEMRKQVGDAFKSSKIAVPKPRIAQLPKPPSQRPPPVRSVPITRPTLPQSESSEEYSDYYDDDEEEDESEDDVVIDPLEEETLKAVRKAKLLARIQQLESRGLKASKKFNYRSSEEELLSEVALMEIMAERARRIEQGRAGFMGFVKANESLANFVDGRKWLPIELKLQGFGNHILNEIDKYDDCLERGVAETLGPVGSKIWWVDLLSFYIPSMIMFSMTNRATSDPKYAGELLRRNPEFQERLAREYAKEFSHTERLEKNRIEQELREAKAQLTHIEENHQYGGPTVNTLPNVNIPQMKPPAPRVPSRIPNTNPLGDYPVNENETAKMVSFLAQQQQRQQQNVSQTVRNEVQRGMQDIQQNLMETQRRQAEMERKKREEEEARLSATRQRLEAQQLRRDEPTTRPHVPPPVSRALPPRPSARPAMTTLQMSDDDESEAPV